MGKSELTADERFITLLARKKNEATLNSLVEEWTVGPEPEEVMNRLQSQG